MRRIVREIQTATPRLELQRFVRVFAQRDVFCTEELTQTDTASLEHILAFGFGDAARIDYTDGTSKVVPPIHVVGSQTAHKGCAYFVGRHVGFGIFLKPLALWQLFRIPPAEIADENGEGTDLLGIGLSTLWLELSECRSFRERILTAEKYLLPFAINATPKTLILKTAHYAYRNDGLIRIEDLANHSGLSLRQYERRFATEIGFTPKLFARITRFQMALDTKRRAPQRSWMYIAHQLGYFDQMHMVRDFQSLGGALPGEILTQIGDYQPWSLAPQDRPYTFPT
jgi:AraC-like DNA-binding protein